MRPGTLHFIRDIVAILVIGLMCLKASAAASELAFAIAALCGAVGVSRYMNMNRTPKKKKEKPDAG